MRMIERVMRSMRDTGLLDGMSDEDLDTVATAALEALQAPSVPVMNVLNSYLDDRDPMGCWVRCMDAALNE